MKWFKHFSDMHDGRSINNLMDELGHMGLCFFLLQEMCTAKLDKANDQDLKESDCVFGFHPRIVRQKLRVSPTNLRRLLDVCATNGLLSFEFSDNSLQISMPILLYLLDRRSKKASERRRSCVIKMSPEKKKKEKENREEEEIDNINSYLEQVLKAQVGETQRYANEILSIHKTSDNFKAWLENLINYNNNASPENPGRLRYIQVSILKSIGVIKAAND